MRVMVEIAYTQRLNTSDFTENGNGLTVSILHLEIIIQMKLMKMASYITIQKPTTTSRDEGSLSYQKTRFKSPQWL